MAYNIYKSNGVAVSVPDNIIDSQFYSPNFNGVGKGLGTQLVGRNAIDYGAPVAQNFLQLTENFANNVVPEDSTALVGQIWFNTQNTQVYIRATDLNIGIDNWMKFVTISLDGSVDIEGDLIVTGSVASRGGRCAVVNPVGTPLDGDIKVEGTTIYIYASGAWRQIYPALYS